CMQSLEFPYSF
nr:immunoglobulin light chain junction region [Macaca mulatta]MOV61517.1 immunoglobulin light chain junction region [Macaca mulatta]MOV61669.1 immunoglobulin light chain junction region [Macaca mulatta]MOV61976.1 immunoglobulin light chain junction region [Macaca mulatta]MOV62058.1 immunoglobulin light chain junction region [Macaca mulatta]